jgi:hypothetical protein
MTKKMEHACNPSIPPTRIIYMSSQLLHDLYIVQYIIVFRRIPYMVTNNGSAKPMADIAPFLFLHCFEAYFITPCLNAIALRNVICLIVYRSNCATIS